MLYIRKKKYTFGEITILFAFSFQDDLSCNIVNNHLNLCDLFPFLHFPFCDFFI